MFVRLLTFNQAQNLACNPQVHSSCTIIGHFDRTSLVYKIRQLWHSV